MKQKKKKGASKKKQKRQQIKEIKFRPVTEKNDYDIKVNKIKNFIENGDKAKITLRFRGRENGPSRDRNGIVKKS